MNINIVDQYIKKKFEKYVEAINEVK